MIIIATAGFIVLIFAVLAYLLVREPQGWVALNYPAELRKAKVRLVDETVSMDGAMKMHGRPDEVYELATGEWVVCEAKRRGRVYVQDVVEMSAAAEALRQAGHPMASYGYIRLHEPEKGTQRFVRVDLLSYEELLARYQRVQGIKEGKIAPEACKHRKLCDQCGHRQRCAVEFAGQAMSRSGSGVGVLYKQQLQPQMR